MSWESGSQPISIFVSYSHHDSSYLANDSLLGFLRGLEREGVELWSDRQIATGERWDEEVRARIGRSDIALVLVSQAFLDSEYCTNAEIRSFLEGHRDSGMIVCPVILSPCEWERHDWLQSRRVLPESGETLEEHYPDDGSRKRLYLKLLQQLRQQVERRRRARTEASRSAASVAAPVPGTSTTAMVGERRQMTVMRCAVGALHSPELEDPELVFELMPFLSDLVERVVTPYGGHLEREETVGSGVTVFFGYPQAHEDDARRAARSALAIVQECVARELSPGGEQAETCSIRVAAHTGQVVIATYHDQERLILGETHKVTDAILRDTAPDAVHVSETTHRLIEGGFSCEPVSCPCSVSRGRSLEVFRVLDGEVDTSRVWNADSGWLIQPMARQLELDLLLDQWQLVQEGLGRAVLLTGEAGLGKSRLVKSLQARLVGEDRTIVECQCSPHYQNTAFYPVVAVLRRLIGDQPANGDSMAGIAVRLLKLLEGSRPQQETPLNFSPEGQGQKIMESALELILKAAEQQQLLLVVEDLHWVDPSTLELLSHLIRQGPSVRLMLLLTFRRRFKPPWSPREHLIHLTLSPLPRKQVEAMIDRLTVGRPLPGRVREAIVQRADGVPLFVEELTRLVQESGGKLTDESDVDALEIPPTLQDWLTARLDRLGEAKHVAQLAGALGRELRFDHLLAISPLDEAELRREIDRLIEAGILYRRGVMPRATLVFKHALIRDAAHESLLRAQRKEVHRRITEVLEGQFPETAEEKPELLAYHSTEAGQREKAVDFWLRAAENAVRASGNAEAVGHAVRGLGLLRLMADSPAHRQQELMLQIALGAALSAAKGYAAPEVETAFARAYDLRRAVPGSRQLFTALDALCFFYLYRGRLAPATRVAEDLLWLATTSSDPELAPTAHWALGVCRVHQGELARSRFHIEEGIALYSSQNSLDDTTIQGPYWAPWSKTKPDLALSVALANLSWVDWLQGRSEEALVSSRYSLTLTQHSPDPFTRAFAVFRAAYLHVFRREWSIALERAQELVEFSDRHGFLFFSGVGSLLEGYCRAQLGEVEEGLRMASEMLDGLWATGRESGWPRRLALVAELFALAGHTHQGLSLLAEALKIGHRDGERHFEAEIYRLQGQLLERRGADGLEVEASYQQALYVARQQGARAWQLRASVSLGRLWLRQGKARQAYDLLNGIHGAFDAGCDTVDLQEAADLLDQLRAS